MTGDDSLACMMKSRRQTSKASLQPVNGPSHPQLSKEKAQVTSKYMKICSILAITEMQIKITLRVSPTCQSGCQHDNRWVRRKTTFTRH